MSWKDSLRRMAHMVRHQHAQGPGNQKALAQYLRGIAECAYRDGDRLLVNALLDMADMLDMWAQRDPWEAISRENLGKLADAMEHLANRGEQPVAPGAAGGVR